MSQCAKMMPDYDGFGFLQCKYDAVDGGQFCGVHDPERKKARAAKRGPRKWERQLAVEMARAEAIKQDREDLAEALSLLRCAQSNWAPGCCHQPEWDERRAALLAKHKETK